MVAEGLDHPEDGLGLQQAVLEEVAAGERGPAALMWTSSRYVAATRSETRLPGFGRAVEAAESAGFPVMLRNSGGGAVAANAGSISLSTIFPVSDLRHGLRERYTMGSELVVAALRRAGVEAEAGEVEGEFCPGAYSVRSGGPRGIKVAGLAQRVTSRAARMEALILVSETEEVSGVLERFYGSLELPFRPESIGDLPVGVPEVIEVLSTGVRERYEARDASPGEETFRRARGLRKGWRAFV